METSGINAELLSDPVHSPLVDAEEPAAAKPKTEGASSAAVEADPATDADEQKTDTPDATDENADKKPSRRQRKLMLERELRSAAEARAEAAERALAEVRAKSAPVEPKLEDYESEAQWLRACQKFDAQQQQARPTESVDSSRARIAQDWTEREKDFVADVPTYEKDVTAFVETEISYFSQAAREKIVELGPEVLHYLATNPDVADDIIELSPRRQVAALAQLDVSKAVGPTGGDAGDEADEVVRVPAAKPIASRPEPPAPAKHTRQGSTAPAGLSDDMDAYIQQRRKQGARWAR